MATLEKRVEALEFVTAGNGGKVAMMGLENGVLKSLSANIRQPHEGESESAYRADVLAGFDLILVIVGVKPGELHGNA